MEAVRLGNSAALDRGEPLEGNLITTINLPDDWTWEQIIAGLTDPDRGIWKAHSRIDSPDWVECDNGDVAKLISEHYGIPIGRTEGEWK